MLHENIEYIDFEADQAELVAEAPQQTQEWLDQRAGHITASRISDMLAGGEGLSREKYKTQLAIERLTGKPLKDGFKNSHMERGNLLEPEARELYCFLYGVDIEQTGFLRHPRIEWLGASPDGLIVGDNGLIEIKSPLPHVHVGYLLNKCIPRKYLLQMQLQMAVTVRMFCDFISYCADMPPRLRLLVIRFRRDNALIAELETEATLFNAEVESLAETMRTL